MNNENSKKLVSIPLFQETLRTLAEKKYFGTRKKLNEEFIEYIKNSKISKEFWEEIKKIRGKSKIPTLDPFEDTECFPIYDYDNERDYQDCNSEWLSSQEKATQKNLEREINILIKSYDLPQNFFDWLESLVLYNQIPPWNPFYNWELPFQIKDVKKISLTTGEKRYIKEYFRKLLSIKRRPPKNKKGKSYKKVCQLLKLSKKNKKRPFLTQQTALKTLEHGQFINHCDEVTRKNKIDKKTYNDLVMEIDEEVKYFGKEHQFAQRLRKQNQRLRERSAKIMNKKKLKK